MRAVAKVARAGLPTVAIVAKLFQRQAEMIASSEGLDSCTIAAYPGVILVDEPDVFEANVLEHVYPSVLEGLTRPAPGAEPTAAEPVGAIDSAPAAAEPVHAPRDVVFRGTLHEVLDEFIARQWSDGLPIIPPTLREVDAFVAASGRRADDIIGVLRPSHREATVWSVAVNAVMAGCRPEYMPVLTAVVECLAEEEFRLEDGGSTPGWEPLVIVSGPVVEQLRFNCLTGALKVGTQANTTVGRFTRMYMRNVARLLPGAGDQGSYGFNFNIALAENVAVLDEIGWPTLGEDESFDRPTSTVSVQSVVTISSSMPSSGITAYENVHTIAPMFCQAIALGGVFGQYNHDVLYTVLVMCPPIARTIARDGWSKDDVRRYFGENMKMNGALVNERAFGGSRRVDFAIERSKMGIAYLKSLGLDPATVDPADIDFPALVSTDKIAITVAGNPGRNHTRALIGNHVQGARITKPIVGLA